MEKARASLVPVVTSSPASRSAAAARVAADQARGLLDQVEQRLALLPGQGLAEQRAEAADVGPQRGVGAVGSVVLVGHRVRSFT